LILGAAGKSSVVTLATPTSTGFDLQGLAKTTDTSVPGIASVRWASFGTPIVNENGYVAFRATVGAPSIAGRIPSANKMGIWLYNGSSTSLVVETGTAVPGLTVPLAALQDPVLNNDGEIAFIGTSVTPRFRAAADAQGIFTATGGTVSKIATAGGPAPIFAGSTSTTGTFASFQQVVLPDTGGPIFTATLRGAKPGKATGLWSADSSGNIYLVAQAGNMVEVHGHPKLIKSISIFNSLPYVSGQSRSFDPQWRNLVFVAYFTDGTWAIIQMVAPNKPIVVV
jgi:hypothetical protein